MYTPEGTGFEMMPHRLVRLSLVWLEGQCLMLTAWEVIEGGAEAQGTATAAVEETVVVIPPSQIHLGGGSGGARKEMKLLLVVVVEEEEDFRITESSTARKCSGRQSRRVRQRPPLCQSVHGALLRTQAL
jgi:hypothetical protein